MLFHSFVYCSIPLHNFTNFIAIENLNLWNLIILQFDINVVKFFLYGASKLYKNGVNVGETSWGARMHTPLVIPGLLSIDIPMYWIDQI